jgi:hypothetical protein
MIESRMKKHQMITPQALVQWGKVGLTLMATKKMSWARVILAYGLLLLVASILMVQTATASTAMLDANVDRYMVSAVLRKGDDGLTIRLVHGVTVSRSAEEAMGDFLKKLILRFPGYSVIDIISDPITGPCHSPATHYWTLVQH